MVQDEYHVVADEQMPLRYHKSLLRSESNNASQHRPYVKHENDHQMDQANHYATHRSFASLTETIDDHQMLSGINKLAGKRTPLHHSQNQCNTHPPSCLPSIRELTDSRYSLHLSNQHSTPISFERSTAAIQLPTPPKLQSPFQSPPKGTGKRMVPLKSKRKASEISSISPCDINSSSPLPSFESLPLRQPFGSSASNNRFQLQGSSPVDDEYVKYLMKSMAIMDDAEDNPGMRDTWSRLLKARPGRIREVCQEILV